MSESEREVALLKMHAERWPWCPLGARVHSHEDELNRGSYVNGRPAGPMWTLMRAEATR